MKQILLVMLAMALFASCQKIGLGEYTSDTSYIAFKKEFTDSTVVSFLFYQDDVIQFPVEMQLAGAILKENKDFVLTVVEDSTTLDAKSYALPERFTFRAGRTTDTAYITLKNSVELKSSVFRLMLQVEDNDNFTSGAVINRRALLLVSDKVSQPTWWTDEDGKDDVWFYYFGKYSDKKYLLVLELSEGMNFENADPIIFRKYAIKLKRYVEDYNAAHPGEPLMDEENNEPMTIPVVG